LKVWNVATPELNEKIQIKEIIAMVAVRKTTKTSVKKIAKQNKVAEISLEERHRMVAEAAYYKAMERNFATGDPKSDWLMAEMEIDAYLNKSKQQSSRVSV
jgi:hypothetical protein